MIKQFFSFVFDKNMISPKYKKVIYILSTAIMLLVLVIGMAPILAGNDDDKLVENNLVDLEYNNFREANEKNNVDEVFDRQITVSPFVSYEIRFHILKDEIKGTPNFNISARKAHVIYENLAIYFLLCVVFFSVIYVVVNENNRETADDGDDFNANDYLDVYVDVLDSEASKRSRHSLLLLISGLCTALAGVVLFFVNFPSNFEYSDYSDKELLILSLRSLFTLVFVESIAWFLLKQYRLSLNSYNLFYNKVKNAHAFRLCYHLIYEDKTDVFKFDQYIEVLMKNLSEEKEFLPTAKEVLSDRSESIVKTTMNEVMKKNKSLS